MNNKLLNDSRGQLNQIFGALIGIIVVFVTLSLGMILVANFQGNVLSPQYKPVPFQDLAFMAVAGVAILSLFIILLKSFT
jgi:hypothetical protein